MIQYTQSQTDFFVESKYIFLKTLNFENNISISRPEKALPQIEFRVVHIVNVDARSDPVKKLDISIERFSKKSYDRIIFTNFQLPEETGIEEN